MNMTIRHHKVSPGQLEEVTRRADTDWIESLRRLPGFVSAYAVRVADDRLTFVTTFVDEADAEKGREASVAWVSQRLMDLDVEPGETWEGPVVAHAGQS
jgi:heme-degrading monooxygenase HmoA